VDGDMANNQHGWQWCAASGTDAAPYFQVFNPTTQGEKFDPVGRLHPALGSRVARGAGRAPENGTAPRIPGADRRPWRRARRSAAPLSEHLSDFSYPKLAGM
jgi:deoxyribodipyrimidine photo-lyase